MGDNQVESILSRFPGPVTLYPSRKKWLLFLLGSALFTAGGVGMVVTKADWGWLVLIFFAVCTAVFGIGLLPGAGRLVLDHDGFQVTTLYRSFRRQWHDVKSFEPVAIPPSMQRSVGYDDVNAGKTITVLNTAISGHNAALPDSYGLSVDDLAQLMLRWRERATSG